MLVEVVCSYNSEHWLGLGELAKFGDDEPVADIEFGQVQQ